MKIVEQSHRIIKPTNWLSELKDIEYAGRIAYKSENKITDDSYESFIKMIIDRGHEAVIEMADMKVHFVTDRGITHELVRHRLASYIQESTRYCNYSATKFGKEVTFIRPSMPCQDPDEYNADFIAWKMMCETAEQQYLSLVDVASGWSPQQARSVLPNCTKTEIFMKANFREWRHIFKLRAISKAAHPDMRRLMIPLYEECRRLCPAIFEMGDPE